MTDIAKTADTQTARAAVENIFTDLRDRRFLKWLFDERGEECLIDTFKDGEELRGLDLEVQEEIKAAWSEIIQKHLVAMLAMERERAWNAGYLAGFMASSEGWNGEYPDDAEIYQRNSHWLWKRLVRWKEYSAPLPAAPEGGEQQ